MESLANSRLPSSSPFHRLLRLSPPRPRVRVTASPNPRCHARVLTSGSVRFDRVLTSDSVGDSFFEAIEELERTVRDPSDVLGGMVGRLSPRELQLVLVYFSQEGRDSYCALEVFDWLRKENRVDGETMELMVSISCAWIERLIGGDHAVRDVVGLLNEMECVGVQPGFSMVEKVVSLYWKREKKEEAVGFVRDVMRRGGVGGYIIGEEGEDRRGGPVGYLAWKMMVSLILLLSVMIKGLIEGSKSLTVGEFAEQERSSTGLQALLTGSPAFALTMVDGNHMGAVKLVVEFKEGGLNPEVYSYLIALTALVKEQKEFSKALRQLKGSIKSGLITELDVENIEYLEKYQADIIRDGVCLSDWAIQEGGSIISGLVHEKLLAIYTCAGCGLEAENQVWQMKLSGKEPDKELRNIVLAICASQKEVGAVRRLLTGMEAMSAGSRKKALSWLLRGYIKGGYYLDASETLLKMLDLGLCPEYMDRVAVLQGLRKSIEESGSMEHYINLCKRLSDLELIGPALVYLYMNRYKLWIMNML